MNLQWPSREGTFHHFADGHFADGHFADGTASMCAPSLIPDYAIDRQSSAGRVAVITPRRQWLSIAMSAGVGWLSAEWPIRSAAAAGWPHERQAGLLHIRSDYPPPKIRTLIGELKLLTTRVPAQLHLPKAVQPIHIYLFARRETLRGYLKQYFPSVPERRALFIKQRGQGMVFAFASDELAVDLRHETTHAVLHSLLPLVPLWLDEGLAEYYERPAGDRIRNSTHLTSVQRSIRWGRVPELRALEDLGDIGDMDGDDYRNAWAWTHFLLHGPAGARKLMIAYLNDLRAQRLPAPISQRLARSMPAWKAAFRHHFQATMRS